MRFLLALPLCLAAFAQPAIRGFSNEQVAARHKLEKKARAIPDPVRLRSYIQRMSAEPHIAGSPASKAVAEYAAELMRGWGLAVEIEEFETLLPYPTTRRLEMLSPAGYVAKLEEPAIPEDPDSADRNQIPTYNAYAATGDVTAPLIYVNYGLPEDYEELRKLRIDPKGKIVIARYGKSWRGTKAKVAQEKGAVGCILYSDPRDDGYFHGDVYPKGAFRPPHGVQRGSVLDMPLYVGDPLTPGWASVKGAKRLPLEQAETLMKIPVLPISYADAQPFLEQLGGPVAPEPWRGALPITYHVGPGPATVRLAVDFDWSNKPIYHPVATIRGGEFPDEWIIYGNHHDAWVNGAHDPASGAAVVLETARTLAEMQKSGWRPRRTIKLALWDAEEFGLIGSTEWAEKYRDDLAQKAVVYFNTDTNGKGFLNAGGSPSLQMFFSQVLRDVESPEHRKPLIEVRPEKDGKPQPFRLTPLGAGSDYVAFIHHLGIPSINPAFSGVDAGGVYHSVYDSFRWYTHFAYTDFSYGKALTQVMVTAILRMADAHVLPFEFGNVVTSVEEWMKDLPKVDMGEVRKQLQRLKAASAGYETSLAKRRTASTAVNQALIRTERALLSPGGLPGRPWYKHQLMAPGLYTGYGAKTLPAIRDSKDPAAGVKRVASTLSAYVSALEEAIRLLSQ